MKTVTLRNPPPDVVRAIRQRATEQGSSLNKAAISLLAARTGPKKEKVLHHDLDALAGSWNKQETAAFDRALTKQRPVDPDLWK
jgi:hypothetical protein